MPLKKKKVSFALSVLSADQNDFFLKAVDEYTSYWLTRVKKKDTCTFCVFLIGQRVDAAKTRNKLNEVQAFAATMPLTISGTILVWYFIVKTFEIDICSGLRIDPCSILFHVMLNCCPQDTSVNTSLCTYTIKSLELMAEIMRFRPNSEAAADACRAHEMDENTLDETDDAKANRNKLAKKLLVIHQLMMADLKKGGCHGYDKDRMSRCIYSNTGGYEHAAINHTLDVDLRSCVHPLWVTLKRNHGTSHDIFLCDESYMMFQPGINKHFTEPHLHGDEKKDMYDDDRHTPDTSVRKSGGVASLFFVEGDLPKKENPLLNEKDKYEHYIKSYNDEANTLLEHMSILYELHIMCEKKSADGIRNTFKALRNDACLWCTLSISPHVRRLLHDLIFMARERLASLGMRCAGVEKCQLMGGDETLSSKFHYGTADECEEEMLKGVPTLHHIRKRGRRPKAPLPEHQKTASPKGNVAYSLDFQNCRVGNEAVRYVFKEWSEIKYPFMKVFFKQCRLTLHETEKIVKHASSDGNIFCVCNKRRMFTDTDCHQRNKHFCFLPLLFIQAKTLLEVRGITKCAKLLSGKLGPLLARHHIASSLI